MRARLRLSRLSCAFLQNSKQRAARQATQLSLSRKCFDRRGDLSSPAKVPSTTNISQSVKRQDLGYCSGATGDSTTPVFDSCDCTDECLHGTHDCHPRAECTDTAEGYSCECGERWFGDGHVCNCAPGSGPGADPLCCICIGERC